MPVTETVDLPVEVPVEVPVAEAVVETPEVVEAGPSRRRMSATSQKPQSRVRIKHTNFVSSLGASVGVELERLLLVIGAGILNIRLHALSVGDADSLQVCRVLLAPVNPLVNISPLLDNATGSARLFVNIPHYTDETCGWHRNDNVAKRQTGDGKGGLVDEHFRV